ncbi:MAG: CPBP family intramembrane metalloprotease [Planctomycetes bacterium]|nr:CPBP family intramembrane metalloprotease [Planctomycetota bacterium]
MNFHRRVRTIYGKELVSILRDRRTLIAMIVVPIVLYPVLMLGSIQAVSFQVDSVSMEAIKIGVISETQGQRLIRMIERDTRTLAAQRTALEESSETSDELPRPIEKYEISRFDTEKHLRDAISHRGVHVGVVFGQDELIGVQHYGDQVPVTIHADLEEVRGASAARRVNDLFERVNMRMRSARLARERLPETFFQPFVTEIIDLSAPQSILGQILPLILILMTITGAIYPAIDLTAGERERGTLESLMSCPTPVIDIVVGKFLVVTTVAIMGAALNLASVSATVYFGGFDRVIAGSGNGLPVAKMIFILLCLIPFAVLMSAIMMAVCSYARTFKEAQNYVTPVILAVLIPGGIAAMPATRLEGIMLVMPVGNMVLLSRDLLLGATVPLLSVAMVLISTTLYACASVAVAANVFGHESVVFADAGSLKGTFSRRTFKPVKRPNISTGLMVVALLFPTWFFVQSAFSPGPGEDASGLLFATGKLMPVVFVLVPLVVVAYWKIGFTSTFALRLPRPRYLAAGVLIGVSSWVPAHELSVFQQSIIGIPQPLVESMETFAAAIAALPLPTAIVLIALVPALCEEFLFRGFLLSSLSTSGRKWTAIAASAVVFGIFHFVLFRFAVTAGLGALLAYLVWQSRSIWPAVLAHLLHNAIGVLSIARPEWPTVIGIPTGTESAHLPAHVLLVGAVILSVGVVLARKAYEPAESAFRPAEYEVNPA